MAEVKEQDIETATVALRVPGRPPERHQSSWKFCWEMHPTDRGPWCGVCRSTYHVAEIVAAYRESCVAEEREACAMLHESVPNECDRDLHRLTVTGCGCGAMGAVIAYRDAIRKRGQRG